MAEQLGEAVLKLTVDDSELRAKISNAKDLIAGLSASASTRGSSSTTRSSGPSSPIGDAGKLINLAKDLNLNTNWGVALRALQEVDADLRLISAGKDFNVATSWTAALQQLQEIDADLRLVSAGEQLNLNSSWAAALEQLQQVDADLRLISAGKEINLRSSWGAALELLQGVDADLKLIAAGDRLNLRNSWTAALQLLEEVDTDLQLISAGKQLNLSSSWRRFLEQAQQVQLDLDNAARERANGQTKSTIRERIAQNRQDLGGFGAASRDNFGASTDTKRSQLEDDLTRVKERRLQRERDRLALSEQIRADERASALASKEEAAARNKIVSGLRKRAGDVTGNALIGGAFPALFGQGAGASVGGALGGAAGGLLGGNFGFGLSLIGTALGQRFDDVGKALESPIKNFDTLKNAALLSSKGLEKTVDALISAGRYAEANALIQQDLQASFGDTSQVTGLQDATRNLNRLFTEATLVMGNFVAGPLTELLNKLRNPGPAPRPNEPSFRQRSSGTLTNTGFGVGALALLTALAGAPTAGIGGLAVGAALVGTGQALKPTPPSPSGTQKNMDAEYASIARKTAAEKQYRDLIASENQLIVAQVQGNRSAADAAQRVAAVAKRNATIQADPTQALTAWREYEKTIIDLNEKQKQREKELSAVIESELIKRQQLAERAAATSARRDAALAAGDAAANPGNSTLAARAGAAEAAAFLAQNRLQVEQAITRQRELQAQLVRESDPTRQQELGAQLATAAQEVRAAGIEAGAALAERAAQAAQSLRGARDALRSTLEGGFRFLSADARQNLRDQAQADVQRGKDSGLLRDNLNPLGTQRLFEAAGFVRNVEQQQAAIAQQQALIDALRENTTAERKIQINVTTSADGTAVVEQTSALM